MARPVDVVTRGLPDHWAIVPHLLELFKRTEGPDEQVTHLYVSPRDWARYAALLTNVHARHTIHGEPGPDARLAFMGCPVVQVPGWPRSLVGFVVRQLGDRVDAPLTQD